jgi:hypothetical protein
MMVIVSCSSDGENPQTPENQVLDNFSIAGQWRSEYVQYALPEEPERWTEKEKDNNLYFKLLIDGTCTYKGKERWEYKLTGNTLDIFTFTVISQASVSHHETYTITDYSKDQMVLTTLHNDLHSKIWEKYYMKRDN